MRVLIAVDHPGDRFGHDRSEGAIDGELVTPVIVGCDDPACTACHGAWFGLASHGPALAAMVVERPGVTAADLRHRVHAWLDCLGVVEQVVEATEAGEFELGGVRITDPVAAVGELVTDHVNEIAEICATFPVGTVLGRLGTLVAPHGVGLAA